jgi:hypothetical protein
VVSTRHTTALLVALLMLLHEPAPSHPASGCLAYHSQSDELIFEKTQRDQEVSEKWDNLDGKLDDAPAIHPFMITWVDVIITAHFGKRDKTKWLLDWVRPSVGTLTPSILLANETLENSIAKALIMAYSSKATQDPSSSNATQDLAAFPCENGIPSITLLGTRSDWKTILDKLDPLLSLKFGKEPAIYGAMLRPVLSRSVETFDKPHDAGVRQFWSDIVTSSPKQSLCHNTTDLVSGWINVFHYWDGAGDRLTNVAPSFNYSASKPTEHAQSDALVLDNITYPWRRLRSLPASYSHLPIYMFGDTGGLRRSQLLVGMLVKSVKQGIPEGYEQAVKQVGFNLPSSVQERDRSTLKPLSAWIYHGDGIGDVCSSLFSTISTL